MTRHFEMNSPRVIATGESEKHAGSRSASTQYPSTETLIRSPALTSLPVNSRGFGPEPFIPLPSGSITPVPALKSLNLTQALLDGIAVVFGFFFLAALFGSLPLAVALMVLGVF